MPAISLYDIINNAGLRTRINKKSGVGVRVDVEITVFGKDSVYLKLPYHNVISTHNRRDRTRADVLPQQSCFLFP